MGFFSEVFTRPKPLPTIHIRDLSGKVIFTANWSSLEGRSLAGLTLHNADLRGARLADADLQGCDLTGSKFQKANLRGCNLENANMSFCDLSGADLHGAKVSGADFVATEFGRKSNRCDMTDAVGIREAIFDSRELIHKGKFNDGKDKKYKPTKLQPLSRAQQARLPERPRCLLVLGELGFQGLRYEGLNSNVQRPRASRRRSHFAKRRGKE
jgi:hypothetical protein